MAYLTYHADIERSLNGLKTPAKKWGRALATIHDPFKLLVPTFHFIALIVLAGLKVCFFSIRKIINH